MALLSWIVFTVAIGLIKPPPHSCWREMNATHQSIERVGYSTSTTKSDVKLHMKRQLVTLPTISSKKFNKTKEIIDQGKNFIVNKTNPVIKNVLNTTISTSRRRKTTVPTTIKTTQRSTIKTNKNDDDDYEDDDVESNEEDNSINENPRTTTTATKSNKKPSDTKNLLHVNAPQKTIGNPIEITLTDLSLVKPLASPVLYDQKDVRNVFMVFLLLIIIGEFFSAPAIALAVRH